MSTTTFAQTSQQRSTQPPRSDAGASGGAKSSARDMLRGLDGYEAQVRAMAPSDQAPPPMGLEPGQRLPAPEAKVTADEHDNLYEKRATENRRTVKSVSEVDGEKTTTVTKGSQQRGFDYTASHATTTTIEKGDDKTEERSSATTSIGKGGFSFSKERAVEETKGVDTLDEETSKGSSKSSLKVNGGGVTRSDTVSHTNTDGSGQTRSSTRAIERGDGKLGSARTSANEETDADGHTTSREATNKAGIIAGSDGMGAYAERERKVEHTRANGLKVGAVGGLDGNVVCDVARVEGTDTYQITVSVRLGGKAGGSGGFERGGAKGGADVSGEAAVTMKVTKTLDAEAAAAYVERVKAANKGSEGGGDRELAIIATGVSQGWGAARAMYDGAKAVSGDAAALDAMAEGDKIELGTEHKGGISGNAGAGALGLGVSGGLESGSSTETSFEKKAGGVIEAKKTVTDTDSGKLGASAEIGIVKGGLSFSSTDKHAFGATFELSPEDPNYALVQKELAACKSQQDLVDFAARWPHAVKDTTTTSGRSSTQGGNIGVGPAKAAIAFGAGYEESVTEDRDGKATARTMKGDNSGSLELGVGPLKLAAGSKESAVAKVGADGKASLDVSETRTDTDTDKLLASLPGMGDKKADGDAPGLLTKLAGGGATKADTTTKHTEGVSVGDADLQTLAAAAQDERAWMSRCPSPRLRADWARAGAELRASGGDTTKVARALSRFVGKDGHGRDEVVSAALRGPGGTGGGARYELPASLAKLKPTWDSLVVGDPCAEIDRAEVGAKAKEGDKADAKGPKDPIVAAAQGVLSTLDVVQAALLSAREQFESAAIHAEMLARVQARKGEVQARIRSLTGREGAESREEAKARYDDLLANCQAMKSKELELYAAIANQGKGDFIADRTGDVIANVGRVNELRDLYAVWGRQYDELAALALAHGLGSDTYFQFQPDHARLAEVAKGATDTGPSKLAPAAKKAKTPEVKRAEKDPVGQAHKAVDEQARQSANGIRIQVPSVRNRAHGMGNRLHAWLGQARSPSGIDAHNRGMAKLQSAERMFARLSAKATSEDWQAYGFAALQDFQAAMAAFQEGLALFPAGRPGASAAAAA